MKKIAKLLSMADMLHSLTFQIRAIYSAFAATPELSGLTNNHLLAGRLVGWPLGWAQLGSFSACLS